MSLFNVETLIKSVFQPGADERIQLMMDEPHGSITDSKAWQARREMAAAWQDALEQNMNVLPAASFAATGQNNGELPAEMRVGKVVQPLSDIFEQADIILALTQFSATAPLIKLARKHGGLRGASLPGVLPSMEQTALAVDYRDLARRTHILAERLTRAEYADVTFSTGHSVHFDLRFRRGFADDGQCPRGKAHPIINLPSGESFIVPYEGEQDDIASDTCGQIPVPAGNNAVVFEVQNNQIKEISGPAEPASVWQRFFDKDPARRNVAELGLGCNPNAVVSGNVLEDEKAGFHWAYGRSEHLGGQTGPESFDSPDHVVHTDIVYAAGSPISIARMDLHYDGGCSECIMLHNAYRVF